MDGARILIAAAFATWSVALAGLTVQLIQAVPRPQRGEREPPPLLFRLAWWPIVVTAHYIGPLLRASVRVRLMQRLQQADLDRALDPELWFGMRVVLALLSGAMALLAGGRSLVPIVLALAAGWLAPEFWLADRIRRRLAAMLRELPAYLDMITLGLEAGCSFSSSLQVAVERGIDGPLRRSLQRTLQEIRAGRPRIEALQRLERRLHLPAATAAITAIVQAEVSGISLGPIMRSQSLRRTQERFARAEKLAMEAPVKMLGPLIACIFPCTFLVIGFPIAAKFIWGV